MSRSCYAIVLVLVVTGRARATADDVPQEVARMLSSSTPASGTLEGFAASYRIDVTGMYHKQSSTTLLVKQLSPELRLQVRARDPGDDDLQRHNQLVDVQLGQTGIV